jgi:putative restriction endonuclease
MATGKWSREETLLAFSIYCRTPFGRLHARNPEIIDAASRIGRTPNALAMKCCNLASFDPDLASRGIRGLSKASSLDKQVWTEFTLAPEDTAFEAETVFSQVMQQNLRAELNVRWEDVRGIDRQAMTKVRVNQHFFRTMIIAGYRGRCAICHLPLSQLLVASHIVPWSVDGSQRMNPQNGICLCMMHDRAFDTGLLLIDHDYKVSLAQVVWSEEKYDAVRDYFVKYDGQSISLPDRWHPTRELLARRSKLIQAALNTKPESSNAKGKHSFR